MPYIQRSASGDIVALLGEAQKGEEYLPSSHPDVIEFLSTSDSDAAFALLDFGFIRVVEDLIDTLINKGLLRLTDLPIEAQTKLLSRKGIRDSILDPLNLDEKNDVI